MEVIIVVHLWLSSELSIGCADSSGQRVPWDRSNNWHQSAAGDKSKFRDPSHPVTALIRGAAGGMEPEGQAAGGMEPEGQEGKAESGN